MHPRLFQLGHLVLPTYGVLLALGLIVALAVCLRAARLLSLNTDKVWTLALLAVIVTIAGAKLLLVAIRLPGYGSRAWSLSPYDAPGALLGGSAMAIVLCWLYARRAGLPIRRTADAFAPALALGNSVAAIGCLEAGCGYGTPTRAPWAVIYNSPFVAPGAPLGVPLHPTQIYSSMAEFALFVFLFWMIHRPHGDGEIMGAWLFFAGLGDFFLAFVRGDEGGGRLFGGWVTVSQLIGAAMVLLGGFLWMRQARSFEAPHAG